MAVLTTQSLLESTEAAIAVVLGSGQSYTIGSRRYTRADIGDLMRMRKDLKAQYELENNGPLRNYAHFSEPA